MQSKEYSKINNICLVILTAIALTGALIYTRSILVPFVIAIFIYAVFTPVIAWFQNRLKLPRYMAIGLTIVLVLAVLALLGLLIANSIDKFIGNMEAYKKTIVQFIQDAGPKLQEWGINLDVQQEKWTAFVHDLPFFAWIQSVTGEAFSFLGNAALVLIFVLFLIAGGGIQKTRHPLAGEIQNKVSRYVATKFFVSIATAVLVGLLLWACRVDLAFMFAVLTFFLNFIPNVGSLIAIALPLPVVLLQFGLGWPFWVVLAGSSTIQFLIGNVLEPKLMGESMDLHPITILMFLMFWGLVWGIPGMFLAVPITAILKIILSRIPTTKSWAELLAGRFATNFPR